MCTQPIVLEALELIAPRELTMELEISAGGLCQPATEGHICTFSAGGLIAPSSENKVRSEIFKVAYGADAPLITDVRWHYSADTLKANFANPVVALDEAQIAGGLGVRFYKRRRPFQTRLRAAYKEALQKVEMNLVSPTGNSTTTVEVAVAWEDLLGQNTESMQKTDWL